MALLKKNKFTKVYQHFGNKIGQLKIIANNNNVKYEVIFNDNAFSNTERKNVF